MTKSVPNPDRGTAELEGLLDCHEHQGVLDGRIVVDEWAGGIEETKARMPQLRIGQRWVSALWLIPIAGVGLVVTIAVAQQLRTYGWMQYFIRQYPGARGDYAPVITTGMPGWLRIQHALNLMFMLFIIRAGLQILADHPRLYLNAGCKPGTEWLRLRGPIPADRQDQRDAALLRDRGGGGLRHEGGRADVRRATVAQPAAARPRAPRRPGPVRPHQPGRAAHRGRPPVAAAGAGDRRRRRERGPHGARLRVTGRRHSGSRHVDRDS